jgi:capsular exopolysaccharide synthesis family protein
MAHNAFWSQRMLAKMKANKIFLVCCMALGSLAAATYCYFTPPAYESIATLRPLDTGEKTNPETEAAVLCSQKTIQQAIVGKGLNVEYYATKQFQMKELFANSPITVSYTDAEKTFSSQLFAVELMNDVTYKLSYSAGSIPLQKEGSFNEPLDLGFIKLILQKTPFASSSSNMDNLHFIIYSDAALAQKISNEKIQCNAAPGAANVIQVSYQNESPLKAYRVLDALTKAYGQNGNVNNEAKMQANVDLINNQLTRVSQELDAAQSEIAKYQIENNAYEIPLQAGATLNTVSQLQIQKVEVDMQLAALDNMSDYMRKNRNINAISPEYGTITDVIYTETYLKLNDKVAERQQLKEQGADVSRVDREISGLKDMLAESMRNTRKKLTIKQQTLAEAIVAAKGRMQNLPEAENKMQQLNRNIYLYTKLFDFLIQKRAEAMVAAPVLPYSSYIINQASMPVSPVSPSPFRIFLLTIGCFLIAGILVLIMKPYVKINISNRTELQRHTDIPFLGNIENTGRHFHVSDAYMNLCTKILMLDKENPVKMITITAANAGDGTTTVAQNLAKAIGSLNKKVLLVDMNPVNQALKALVTDEHEGGFSEIFDAEKTLHQSLQETTSTNVDLLSAGRLKHGVNTLLVSDKTGNIIADMKQLYDFIIFDTPETSNYIDAMPLMKYSDLNLFVIKANKTSFEQVQQATTLKNDFKVQNLYIVLNAVTENNNHSGLQTTGSFRVIKNRAQADAETNFIPRMLRKAALWFY